jgi:hypothetical protein
MASISLSAKVRSPAEAFHHGASFVRRKNVTDTSRQGDRKFLSTPLKPNGGFLIFLLPPQGGPGA